jgi:chromosomal replication initiation ATPase DnaA
MMNAEQYPLDLLFRKAYGRDDLLVGSCNQDAVALIEKWPDWNGFPAIILYGDEGSGKSHAASVWQDLSQAKFLSSSDFQKADSDFFLQSSEKNYVLEDLHDNIGSVVYETKLFHLYNYLKAHQGSMLLTSRLPPASLSFIIADLASRLRSCWAVQINAPDQEILKQVLVKQLLDYGLKIDSDVMEYAVSLMGSSWSQAKKLAEALHDRALRLKRPISKTMILEALKELPESDL